ncbi:hypothetical protein HGRIS_012003 [Hohenbuehelia grisea]|uniref:Uncharacterized protein n=1 Tax=Hohenbuehelia grisea TaxID=104357 RepID=A0ABR3JN14_9AGAR
MTEGDERATGKPWYIYRYEDWIYANNPDAPSTRNSSGSLTFFGSIHSPSIHVVRLCPASPRSSLISLMRLDGSPTGRKSRSDISHSIFVFHTSRLDLISHIMQA